MAKQRDFGWVAKWAMGWVWLFATATLVIAQSEFTPYAWIEGDIALQIPANWQTATRSDEPTTQQVIVAQAFANDDANRPVAIPFVAVSRRFGAAEQDATADLTNALFAIDLTTINAPQPIAFLERVGVAVQATNADQTLFGLGRAVVLPDGSIVVIVGRALAEQEASFTALFNAVADSVALGAGTVTESPNYGVLWSLLTTNGQSTVVLSQIRSMTYQNGRLFVLDAVTGVVEIDPSNGNILAVIPFDTVADPTDIALNGAVILVGDLLCHCVRQYANGEWSIFAEMAVDAPQHIAVANGMVYATDLFAMDATQSVVVVDIFAESFSQASFEEALTEQPFLVADAGGRLLAVNPSDFSVYVTDNIGFTKSAQLENAPELVNGVAVTSTNQIVLATQEAGVAIFNELGKSIGTVGNVVSSFPNAGEFLHPQAVATAPDGTIFVADSDGLFGRITAMSLSVEAGRVGGNELENGVVVEGVLDDRLSEQSWYFVANAGDTVTINAVMVDPTAFVDVSVRLLAPNGQELAFNDNQESGLLPILTDAQLQDVVLNQAGEYTVVVERVQGRGRYRMGISLSQTFTLTPEQTVLVGSLSDVVQKQRWTFEGTFGTTLSLTLTTENGTLDPMMRLLDGAGNVLAENDDAFDLSLGRNAQLLDVQLANSGVYVIEAVRVGGDGQYRLTIQENP